ncbi:MAG: glycosyltransferase [Clostridia bacterium]|nr:glycosyltransferase [Clostridia bacterium]
MNILILSIKAGMGHHKTGMAIQNYFESRGCKCEMINTFDYISRALSESVNQGYLLSTKFTPHMWGRVYRIAEKKQKTDPTFLSDLVSKIASGKLLKYVQDFRPDAIVCTHVFASLIATYFKRKCDITCPMYGIITDFTVHPFWQDVDMDYYVTPSRLLNLQLEKKGLDANKALPFGIPIDPKFSTKTEKRAARELLGIENKPTILVMMGSMGHGKLIGSLETLDAMQADFQIICVCGNNKRMKKNIESHSWSKTIMALGYVNNVELLMDAADVIITKPGGLTTSEFLAKGLPAILLNPIPGQEDRNVEFLLNNGLAILVSKTFPIDEAVYQLLQHSWRLDILSIAAKNMGKPNAVSDLYNHIAMNHMNRFKADRSLEQ